MGIRPTALVNSEIYDHAPEVPAAFRALGAEFVAHGRTNSATPNSLTGDAEQETIDSSTAPSPTPRARRRAGG